jgi:hypothetical protein
MFEKVEKMPKSELNKKFFPFTDILGCHFFDNVSLAKVKFMFFKKATKNYKIFTINLTLTK